VHVADPVIAGRCSCLGGREREDLDLVAAEQPARQMRKTIKGELARNKALEGKEEEEEEEEEDFEGTCWEP
jgi:hypothetical protein